MASLPVSNETGIVTNLVEVHLIFRFDNESILDIIGSDRNSACK